MRIAITTFYTHSYEPLAAITIPVLQKYADKHGYFLNVNKVPDGNVDFVITKDAKELLKEYDLVMGIECDVLITNLTIKIESFLTRWADFWICNDINGVNFGCFIVKQTFIGLGIISFILSKQGKCKTEQNVLENNYSECVTYLPHPSINSIPYDPYYYPSYGKIGYNSGETVSLPTMEQGRWEKGMFNCHLPGMTLQNRIDIFNKIKEDIVYGD